MIHLNMLAGNMVLMTNLILLMKVSLNNVCLRLLEFYSIDTTMLDGATIREAPGQLYMCNSLYYFILLFYARFPQQRTRTFLDESE